ncbi:hypothetical protein NHQ30_010849 [Ciborinia camelliae]|nr:hypothetical protein NHQ30_010849 [Ciborinia camelliae]
MTPENLIGLQEMHLVANKVIETMQTIETLLENAKGLTTEVGKIRDGARRIQFISEVDVIKNSVELLVAHVGALRISMGRVQENLMNGNERVG